MSTLTTAAYLVSSVLFILSLRGLSHPSTARRGNFLGILGMAIAIVTTLSNPGVLSYKEIGIAFLIGGLIGTSIAVKIQMTALPQLVAAFHSLVGLAAVFVAASAYYNPSAFNIGTVGSIPMGSFETARHQSNRCSAGSGRPRDAGLKPSRSASTNPAASL